MILHTVGSLGKDAGGPSRTVPALCQNLIEVGVADVAIITGRSVKFGQNRLLDNVRVIEADCGRTSHWERLIFELLSQSNGAGSSRKTLLHDHGQWLPINRASARLARRYAIPRIVTPRGMLSPWAMNYRRWKKQAAWRLFARRDAASATVLHATSDLEANEFRQIGLKNPIAVIPNGVDFPELDFDSVTKKRQVLFLSRVHPKKGIAELVDVWRELNPQGWNLVLAGPDEMNMVSSLRIEDTDRIQYVGEVEGETKWQLLAESSVFVLPSYSENFGVVVAEALAAGTPVITTHGTPWKSLEDECCGRWIPMDRASLLSTLRSVLAMSDEELREMGNRGKAFALREFGWNGIATEMQQVYKWILGEGGIPSCVHLD